MTTGFQASDGSRTTSGDPAGDIRDIRHVVILRQVDSDCIWSQRFTGHVETGAPSVTG